MTPRVLSIMVTPDGGATCAAGSAGEGASIVGRTGHGRDFPDA
jgi:hypothetical protein